MHCRSKIAVAGTLLVTSGLATSARSQVVDQDRSQLEQTGQEMVGEAEPKAEIGGIPAIFSTPETGVGGGAAIIYIPPPVGQKVSSALAGFLVTAKQQFLAALYTEQYFASDRLAAELFLGYQMYPDSFFGIGDDTSRADEELYTWNQQRSALSLRWLFTPEFRAGAHVINERDSFADIEAGGQLDAGILGTEGGRLRGVGASIRWDDLDDGYTPTTGTVANVSGTRYSKDFGSEYEFNNYEANLKYFKALDADSVIGAQLYGQANTGDPPFYQLAQLGGKNLLRGYFLGRYRDRNMMVFQSEYRRKIVGRFGGVLFAGVGDVARDPNGFRTRDLKPGGGAGVRYQLTEKQKINLRLDLGFAPHEDSPSIYLYILEAF